jgi:hypothetical protein
MGLPPTIPATQVTLWQTSSPLPLLGLLCALLCIAHWLPLALPAQQFSAVADGVLPLALICRTGLWTLLYRALHKAERRRVGRDPNPSAAIMDAASV